MGRGCAPAQGLSWVEAGQGQAPHGELWGGLACLQGGGLCVEAGCRWAVGDGL